MKRAVLFLAFVVPAICNAQADSMFYQRPDDEQPTIRANALFDLVFHGGFREGSVSIRPMSRDEATLKAWQCFQVAEQRIAKGGVSREKDPVGGDFWRERFWLFKWFRLELAPELAKFVDLDAYDTRVERVKQGLARVGIAVNDRYARFSDVPAGHWADEAIHKLRKAGVLRGYPDNTFRG